MGCLKLTYDYQEQGEKNYSLDWQVWVNPESGFLGVVEQQTQGGVLGTGVWNYNENLDLGLSVAGGIAGAFETGGAISLSQLTRGGSVVRLADQAKYLGAVKYVKALGNVGTGLSVAVALHEISTGNDDTHTWVDLGITGLGVGAVIIGGTAAAPFVIAGGLVYGIWSMAGGSDWIDKNWGYNTSKSGGK